LFLTEQYDIVLRSESLLFYSSTGGRNSSFGNVCVG
jgi:hypothetical protein